MAGIIDAVSFSTSLAAQYTAVRDGMDAVLASEMKVVIPVLKSVLPVYTLVQFVLFGKGLITGFAFVGRLVRAVAVSFILSNLWVGYVTDYSFEKIPTALASSASAGTAKLTMPEQFDKVSKAIDNLTAEIRTRNTSWSVSAIGNSMMTWLVWGGMQTMLGLQAYVWLTSIRIMALLLCVGAWLILFELFDRTRGFFQHWIGLVVGLWTFQLAASVQLQASMRSEMDLLRAIHEQAANNSVDMMLANMGQVGNALVGDALTMLALPTVVGGAAGIGAQIGVAALARAFPGMAERMSRRVRRLKQREAAT
ncbi:type IV secretion system protein [Paracraurococcus lichenis]|uniref:Type IV secretion system protein n=1 Tax=Paracraurococcus lichenis TaxID=3064888 RepID=A0ABT9E8P0_9PROT|nr:type IV secretion system protein [Paracraurococcus sp. LOR1-02]MDO9712548.1 type IV secretion system protein [Paracraurococcus sp. LOR1-02]